MPEDFSDFVLVTIIEGPDSRDKKKVAKEGRYECKVNLVESNFENFQKLVDLSNNNIFFHMFEQKAYYESYRHILRRLQELDTRSLPFEDILINFNKNQVLANSETRANILRSGFYNNSTNNVMMPSCFSVNTRMTYEKKPFLVYKDQSWPSELTENLDKSQLSALRHGIRNKIAIIQGPPGTGKTFVGAKLTKILLENS